MELSLSRRDLAQVGATARGTMRLLSKPNKPNDTQSQRLVVGDATGALFCFGLAKKSNAFELLFQTTPDPNDTGVDAVSIDQDRIFWASGQLVRGVTKRGKEFLRFRTDLAEPIRSMVVSGEAIHAAGTFTYNEFLNCKGSASYMAADRINDVTSVNLSAGSRPDVVLGCQDRSVRVLHGSTLLHELPTNGPVSVVEAYHNPDVGTERVGTFGSETPAAVASSSPSLIYGTDSGQVVQLYLDGTSLRRGWCIDPPAENRRSKAGGVHCMAVADVTNDGVKDLLIGRDNGLVEIWSFDTGDEPKLAFERELQESVTSIACGCVSNTSGYDEVVVATYSGKLISFSTEPLGDRAGAGAAAAAVAGRGTAAGAASAVASGGGAKGANREGELRSLMSELDALRVKVDRQRTKYSKISESLVAADVQLKLKDKFVLSPEEACYKLDVELTVPIETVVLQCDVPVELIDAESNAAIVSRTPLGENATGILVTYRCQEVANRLELRLRTSEGRYGTVQVFVWPRITPKTCCCANYAIKPLSLHTRQHVIEEAALPEMSTLTMGGDFSFSEVHAWVGACLPEVPAKLQAESEDASFTFRNTFLGTYLQCSYRKCEATFRSDSLTALSVMKEVLTREATSRNKKVSASVDAKYETVANLLEKIHLLVEHQLALDHKVKLIDSLKEVKMQENDGSFLSPEYVEILANEESLLRQLKEQPARLEFLFGIIVDLYVDNFKFKGKNMAPHVPKLYRMLHTSYSLARLKDVIEKGDVLNS